MAHATQTRCLVCGKRCVSSERNTDGTFAHAGCLRATALWPVGRSVRGKNIYNTGGEDK